MHCRGEDSQARRGTCSPYKLPSKWETPPNCHSEERSDVGISGRHFRLTKKPRRNRKASPGHFSVKMYLTFRARVDIIKMWKPGRLPQHMCFRICELCYPQIKEPSVAADGSLFSISEPINDLADQPDDWMGLGFGGKKSVKGNRQGVLSRSITRRSGKLQNNKLQINILQFCRQLGEKPVRDF